MTIPSIPRAAPPPAEASATARKPVADAVEQSLRDDFERRLDALSSRGLDRPPLDRPPLDRRPRRIEPLDAIAEAPGSKPAHAGSAALSQADGMASGGAPMSLLEFTAALERLQVPVAAPGAPAQWEFTLDSSHAPLQAVRVTESAAGGWDVALQAALPHERPLLAARLDRLRSRLSGRGVPVAHLRVDESEG
jgi:hypothetical protein